MKFVVYYLQFVNSPEGPGMFFSSAALIRRLRRYAATPPTEDDFITVLWECLEFGP